MTSTDGHPAHDVYALRYASALGTRSQVFHYHHGHDDADGEQGIDYYFWLVRREGRTILVDCGFDAQRGQRRGRTHTSSPLELLQRMGVAASDVDCVVVSHLHYDHVGNIAAFPNATVVLARDEYDYWMSPAVLDRRINAMVVDQEDLEAIAAVEADGRLQLVSGPAEVSPGIVVTPVGGHTPGQMITHVTTTQGSLVLASDAAHFAQEWSVDLPFALFHDLDDLWAGYELLARLDAEPGTTVIPGHDPLTATSFVAVQQNCFDLNAARH